MYKFNLAEFNTQRPSMFIPTVEQAISPAPQNCIVAVLLRDRQPVGCLVRELETDWIHLIEDITSGAQATETNELLITIHAPRGEALPFNRELQDCMETFRQMDILVLDAYQVTDERYWSYFCRSASCCNPDGNVITKPSQPSDAELAEAEEISTQDVIAKAAAALPVNAYDVAKVVWNQLNRLCEEKDTLSPEQTMFFRSCIMIAVQEVQIRDYVLGELAHSNGEKCALAAELANIACRTPAELRGRVAGMAAGALAATGGSVDQVAELVQLSNGDSLARLIDLAVQRSMPIDGVLQIFSDARERVEQHLLASR